MAFIKSLIKTGIFSLFAVYGWLRLRFTKSPVLIILTYHRILPADATERHFEQPGMVTRPELLAQHIRVMQGLGAVAVHLDEWLDKQARKQTLPRLAFAVTFDDGWRDNFDHAYPKLRQQNIPATIFLVTRMTNSQDTFWPERVLQLLTNRSIAEAGPGYQWLVPFLPEDRRHKGPLTLQEADGVISKLKSLPDESIYAHLRQIAPEDEANIRANEQQRAILNDQEISEMAESGLIKFGAHTRHHYRLNRLSDPSNLKAEIVGSLEDLHSLGEAAVPIFCYPNGDITKDGHVLVKENFKAACTTQTGWNPADSRSPYDLHRFNLHDGNSFNRFRFLASLGLGIK